MRLSCSNSPPSRRVFLASVAAALAPMVVISCRRGRGSGSSEQTTAPPLHDLDDVGDVATFRPDLPSSEPVVRVRILRVREKTDSTVVVGGDGQWLMLRGRGESEAAAVAPASINAAHAPVNEHSRSASSRGVAVRGPLRITMNAGRPGNTEGGWSIVDADGFRAVVQAHETLEIFVLGDDADPMIALAPSGAAEPKQYRGWLRLVSRHELAVLAATSGSERTSAEAASAPACAFDIVNCVAIEHYLPGVLAGELYPRWQPETFAAQAIAARSFAATEAAIFAGRRHYDLSNTAASQMYLGVVTGGVREKAHDAVLATRGVVLAFGDGAAAQKLLLVSGYYSSCCGGVAASAVDAIGPNAVNRVEPLQGRSGSDVCTEAPVYAWSVEQPIDQVAQRIAGFARERGQRELQAIAAAGGLASVEVAASNPHGRPTRMALTDGAGSRSELSAENFRRAVNWAGTGGNRTALKPPDKELRSSNVRTTIGGSTARFDGRGFGHGVGLCQFGAEALAKSGMPHGEILRWYYPQVQIVRVYG